MDGHVLLILIYWPFACQGNVAQLIFASRSSFTTLLQDHKECRNTLSRSEKIAREHTWGSFKKIATGVKDKWQDLQELENKGVQPVNAQKPRLTFR